MVSPNTPQQPDSAALQHELASLRQELAELKGRSDRLLASWQRSEADLSNLRKRMEAERKDMGKAAAAVVISEFLPMIDDLERALATVAEPLRGFTWVDGIWLTYRKFLAVLESYEIRPIDAADKPFDPKLHQAVQEMAGEPGKVLHVVQQGYLLGDQVLRPALVVVGKAANAR